MIRATAACLVLLLGASAGAAPASIPAAPAPAAGAVVAGAAAVVAAPVVYAAPVPSPLRVLRGFDPPSSPYGPGHRGVDLATSGGETIRAAADATVQFAGSVAGRGVVVLAHPDGVTTEYEPVRPLVHANEPVARGRPIGRIDGTHGSCVPGGCLHWGARRAGAYFDPLSLLRPLGPVRLLPWTDP